MQAIILIRIITNTTCAKTKVKFKRYDLPVVGSMLTPLCDCLPHSFFMTRSNGFCTKDSHLHPTVTHHLQNMTLM